ncbi:MAG: beta-lactamase family protein [Clostridia bacterium]|nr:beta-lactamase family protein [Clostridia bacterium]
MDKKALIEKLAHDAYAKGGFNGTWLYAEGGEIVSQGALGWRDDKDQLPMTEDSIYELASITKQFTAAAVMLLVRRGLLSLDDDITKFFPDIPYKGATIRHFLNHTAGTPEIYESDWMVELSHKEGIPSNDIVPRYLVESGEEPHFAPGEQWEYSNTNYNLLALLVERLAGIPFEDFLKQNLFEPAGMVDTAVYHLRRDGIPSDRIVRNMVLEDGKFILPDDSEEYADQVIPVDGLNGDDYVYTTNMDMLRWDRALREGKIITLEEQKLMYTPARLNNGEEYREDDGEGYGFGWGVWQHPTLGLVVDHSGGMPGLGTWYERMIDADRVLVFLISRDPKDYRAEAGFWEGMRKIAHDEEPDPIQSLDDLVIKNPDKSKWESYCGHYETSEVFPLGEVYLKDGELHGKVMWDEDDPFDCVLYPIGENTFGRRGGMVKITFGDGCYVVDDVTCKKI